MLTLTPTTCSVNDHRIREALTVAEHRAALGYDAPAPRRSAVASLMARMAGRVAVPVAPRPALRVSPRT